jgi:hypothetical protein
MIAVIAGVVNVTKARVADPGTSHASTLKHSI